MDLKKDFGLRLKELRIKKGITQSHLAEITGIDPKHISHIETGRSFPKADLIEKLANALDVDYTKLFLTSHLKNNEALKEQINLLLLKATEEELKIIYKIISGIVE